MPLRHERPSPEYMRELRAVARSASALRNHLPTINLLPDGFPLEQVEGFCNALIRLPQGTAEGSIAPLRSADSELNRIRQRFIPTYDEEEDDEEPLIAREGDLDLRLTSLMTAVRSAIERYKAEAGDELDTDVTPDLPANPAIAEPVTEALASLEEADHQVADAERLINEADEYIRQNLENEERVVADTGTQLTSTRAALSTETPRPTVLEWLDTGLHKTADELERLTTENREKLEAIGREISDGLGEIIEAWVPLAATVRIVRTKTRNVINILKSGQGGDGPSLLGEPPADFNYVEVYNSLLRGEPVRREWVPFVRELDFSFVSPHHLEEDELALFIGRSEGISDISPLANLTALQSLDLAGTQVANIELLANLTALQSLNLKDTQVVNIEPLANLTALQSLDLMGTQVANIEPLANLTALQSLNLVVTEVANIEPLANLTALQSLDLMVTQVTNVEPLANLTALQSLDLMDTQVANIEPLANLTALQSLDLTGTQVANVEPLANLTALQYLSLLGTQVANVEPLANLTALQYLDLRDTQVSDISALEHLKDLQFYAPKGIGTSG